MNDLIDKIDLFLRSERKKIADYRYSLYSKLLYDGYHCSTAKGHVISVIQYRKDFYKPRGFTINPEDFFAINQWLRNQKMKYLVETVEEKYKQFFQELEFLINNGYVLAHCPLKTLKTLQYVDKESLDFLEARKDEIELPGHIRAIRYNSPQYPEHKPLVTDDGRQFFYRTSYTPIYKPDMDMTGTTNYDDDEIIENGDYNIVTHPSEEPLTIG